MTYSRTYDAAARTKFRNIMIAVCVVVPMSLMGLLALKFVSFLTSPPSKPAFSVTTTTEYKSSNPETFENVEFNFGPAQPGVEIDPGMIVDPMADGTFERPMNQPAYTPMDFSAPAFHQPQIRHHRSSLRFGPAMPLIVIALCLCFTMFLVTRARNKNRSARSYAQAASAPRQNVSPVESQRLEELAIKLEERLTNLETILMDRSKR